MNARAPRRGVGRRRGRDAVPPLPSLLEAKALQSRLKKQPDKDFHMPILHLFTADRLGRRPDGLGVRFRRLVVSMQPVVEKLAL